MWEEQFSFPSSIPEIDLFGGEVYTPWPDAVPEQKQWLGPGLAMEKQSKWERAFEQGLTEAVVEADILKDWVVETPREYWEHSPWKDRFRNEVTKSERDYRMQVAIGRHTKTVSVNAKIPAHWYWPTPKEYWLQTDWRERFWYEDPISKRGTEWSFMSEIPLVKWLLDEEEGGELRNTLKNANYRGLAKSENKYSKTCPHCGETELHDQIGVGEIKRGSTCSSCGNWYTVFERDSDDALG